MIFTCFSISKSCSVKLFLDKIKRGGKRRSCGGFSSVSAWVLFCQSTISFTPLPLWGQTKAHLPQPTASTTGALASDVYPRGLPLSQLATKQQGARHVSIAIRWVLALSWLSRGIRNGTLFVRNVFECVLEGWWSTPVFRVTSLALAWHGALSCRPRQRQQWLVGSLRCWD